MSDATKPRVAWVSLLLYLAGAWALWFEVGWVGLLGVTLVAIAYKSAHEFHCHRKAEEPDE